MIGFRNDAEDCNEDGAASDENGANEHPWGENVTQEETSEEGVPEERDSTERC